MRPAFVQFSVDKLNRPMAAGRNAETTVGADVGLSEGAYQHLGRKHHEGDPCHREHDGPGHEVAESAEVDGGVGQAGIEVGRCAGFGHGVGKALNRIQVRSIGAMDPVRPWRRRCTTIVVRCRQSAREDVADDNRNPE
jgi:hypothetical protein